MAGVKERKGWLLFSLLWIPAGCTAFSGHRGKSNTPLPGAPPASRSCESDCPALGMMLSKSFENLGVSGSSTQLTLKGFEILLGKKTASLVKWTVYDIVTPFFSFSWYTSTWNIIFHHVSTAGYPPSILYSKWKKLFCHSLNTPIPLNLLFPPLRLKCFLLPCLPGKCLVTLQVSVQGMLIP